MVQDVEDQFDYQLDGLGGVEQRNQLVIWENSRNIAHSKKQLFQSTRLRILASFFNIKFFICKSSQTTTSAIDRIESDTEHTY